jgi:hypothetical protein
MASENWDDHNRSGRYTARDFAFNYLNTCENNAVLFTNGDNDTFPLWYLQEVEGIRTDVRVINLSYFTADWYITQMQNQIYDSKPVKFGLTEKQYRQGTRDYALFVDDGQLMINEKYQANLITFEKEYQEIFNDFLNVLKKSKVPALAAKDFEEISKGYENFLPEKFPGIIAAIERNKVFEVNEESLKNVKTRTESLLKRIDQSFLPLSDAMNFFKSDDPRFQRGQYFFPARKFILRSDTTNLNSDSTIPEEILRNVVPEIRWDIGRRNITKSGIMTMDLIDANNWERPVYFAITASKDNYLNLDKYLHREGLAYRLLPATGSGNDLFSGNVNTNRMYKNLMETYRWGGIENEKVYLDENNMRMLSNYRYTFATLANALLQEGRVDSAKMVLNRCNELIPQKRVPYNTSVIPLIQVYYNLNDTASANEMLHGYLGILEQELSYYNDLQIFNPERFQLMSSDFQMNLSALYNLYSLANSFKQSEMSDKIIQIMQRFDSGINGLLR